MRWTNCHTDAALALVACTLAGSLLGAAITAVRNKLFVWNEDHKLLARWLAGPGARPTESDIARWRKHIADGRVPRVRR